MKLFLKTIGVSVIIMLVVYIGATIYDANNILFIEKECEQLTPEAEDSLVVLNKNVEILNTIKEDVQKASNSIRTSIDGTKDEYIKIIDAIDEHLLTANKEAIEVIS